jgi:hypothetical protein
MRKRVVDLTAEELDRLAGDAWFEASNAAVRAGVPVVGRDGSKIVKRYPDGRKEILGDAAPLVNAITASPATIEPVGSKPTRQASSKSKKARRTG